MKGTHLGEFEELILLSVGILYPKAYGVGIKKEILNQTGRKVTLSTIHSALHRLEKKGMLTSHFGEATGKRGGKRKKYFNLTAFGKRSLIEVKELREQMWRTLPELALKSV